MDNQTAKKLEKEYKGYPYKLISNEEIEKAGFKWLMKDNLPNSLNDDVYILNTGTRASGGEHWDVCAIQYPNMFFAGSYGATSQYKDRPQKELIELGKRNGFENIYCYENDIQIPTSVACGCFALYIGDILKRNLGNWDEKSFDQMMRREFDQGPTEYNVQKVVNWCKDKHLM